MKPKATSRTLLRTTLAAALLFGILQPAEAGKLRRLIYNDYPGSTVADLFSTNNLGQKTFPDSPDGADYMPPASPGTPPTPPFFAQTAINSADPNYYGSWIRGYLTAPESGQYTFWLSSDDECLFFMNTDSADPLSTSKTNLLCWVPGWSGSAVWDKYASQQSAPVTLEAGKTYYLEMFHKEGSGGDHIVIGWTLPSGLVQRPMPAWHFQPVRDTRWSEPDVEVVLGPVAIKTEYDYMIYDGMQAVAYANVNLNPPVTYQWLKNGTPLAGATQAYYFFRPSQADSGSQWSVQVTSGGNTQTSTAVNLVVASDNDKPTVVSAGLVPQNPTKVQIVFSEEVKASTATTVANYDVTGITIQSATLGPDSRTVVLDTGLVPATRAYTLTVRNVQDNATPANTMDTYTTPLVVSQGAASFRIYNPTLAGDLAGLRTATTTNSTNARYLYDDTFAQFLITTNSYGWNAMDCYVGQMIGYLTPPETGTYKFAVAADDHAILYLGTNDLRSSKREIANVSSYTARWAITSGAYVSGNVSLEAGKMYYIELVYRDGTGGDGFTLFWQTPSSAALPVGSSTQSETQPFVVPAAYMSPYAAYAPMSLKTNLPAALTAGESTRPTLRVTPDGVLPYTYQWFKNDTLIPNVNTNVYTLPFLTPADNNAAYKVVVNNSFSSITSVVATLTVTNDVTKPVVASLGSVVKQTVEVWYSEPVTAASAGGLLNYSLYDGTGASVALNGVVVDTNDPTHVTLQTAPMPDSSLMQLAIRNLTDTSAAANVIAEKTNTFRAFNFDGTLRVNNSQPWAVSANGDQITFTAGGSDIWGTSDQMTFAYKNVTGNFDYRVQAPTAPPTINQWVKMGLMARASTAANSRNVFNAWTPPSPAQNTYTAQVRQENGASSTSSGDAGTPLNSALQGGVAARPTVAYPSWLRLQRVGDTFYYYTSANGTNWTLWTYYDSTQSADGAFPSAMVLGLALTSHDTTWTATSSMAAFAPVSEGSLRIVTNPTNTTVAEGATANFYAAVDGARPYLYQWLKNSTPIQDATNLNLALPRVSFNDNTAQIALRLTNPQGENVVSTAATLTVVRDTVAPTFSFRVLPKINLVGTEVKLLFSEPMNRISVETAANYSITSLPGGAALQVSSAMLDVDDRTLTLTTAAQVAGTTYKVVVNGVTDQACCPPNTIAANSTDYFYYAGSSGKFRQRADGFVIMEAENAALVTGTTPARDWELRSIMPGYSGVGYMVVPTVGGTTGGTSVSGGVGQGTGPAMNFDIVFTLPTTNYTVWVRGWNQDTNTAGNDDSIYAGFDGNLVYLGSAGTDVNYSQMTGWGAAGWDWRSDRSSGTDPVVLTNVVPGSHTFTIWQREDGTLVDKVVIEPGVRSNAGNSTEPAVASSNNGRGEPETWDWLVPPPAAPTVVLAPATGQKFANNANIPLEATVSGQTPVTKVEFFAGSTLLGTVSAAPWIYTWPNAPEGIYSLTARATDGLGYQTTSAASQVIVDSSKPVAYAVGSLDGNSIGVYFSDTTALDPATAADVANYTVNSGAVAVTNANLELDGRAVMLALAAPVSGAFSVQIKNVADTGFGPNVVDTTTLNSTVVTWFLHRDVGTVNTTNPAAFTDPIRPGRAQAIGTDGLYVRASGSDIWNNADGAHFVYQEITGDFDVSTRVQSLSRPNEWAKASMMVREDLEGTSRNLMALVAPPPTGSPAGMNLFNAQIRDAKGGATISLATAQRITPVPYPDAWLRLTRTNQQFTFSWKTNAAANWTTLMVTNVPTAAAYPGKVYVGVATTSHINTDSEASMATAYYRELTGFAVPVAPANPVLSAALVGSELVITWTSDNPNYKLQSNASLASNSWQDAGVAPNVEGNKYTAKVPAGTGQQFYRLATQ